MKYLNFLERKAVAKRLRAGYSAMLRLRYFTRRYENEDFQVHILKAKKLEEAFRRDWGIKFAEVPHVVVHIGSADSLDGKSRSLNKFMQDMQLGRYIPAILICRFLGLKNELTTIIYIAREYDELEKMHIERVLTTSFKDFQQARLHILTPKTCKFFPDGANLSRILHSCAKTMKEIKTIIGSKPAFIIPGVLSDSVYDQSIVTVFSGL